MSTEMPFSKNGILRNPNLHDALFVGFELYPNSILRLKFKRDDRVIFVEVPGFIGLDVTRLLPGNIVFEFKYARLSANNEYRSRIAPYTMYFEKSLLTAAYVFELSTSYGATIVGFSRAPLIDVQAWECLE